MCVFLPARVSMAEPLCLKHNVLNITDPCLRVSVAAVCLRACVFLPARVSMAEALF